MKTNIVTYKKVFNLGNYSNEQIGVEIEVQEGDNVQEVIKQARNFVTLNSNETTRRIEEAENVIAHPDDYTGRAVAAAKKFLADIETMASGPRDQSPQREQRNSRPRPNFREVIVHSRRVKRWRISAALLCMIGHEGIIAGPGERIEVTKDPVPDDARILDARFGGFNGEIVEILLESATFAPVKDGEEIPLLETRLEYKA